MLKSEKIMPGARQAFEKLLDMGGLVTSARVDANWMPDGRFWFVKGVPAETEILVFDPKSCKTEPLFDVERVRAAYKETFGHEAPYTGLPFERFRPAGENSVIVTIKGTDYSLDTKNYSLSALAGANMMDLHTGRAKTALMIPGTFIRPGYFSDQGPVPEPMSPDGRWFSGLKDGDLYIRQTNDNRYDRLTDDAEPDYGWDLESVRVGIGAGATILHNTVSPWSPDSLKFYATKFDTRNVRGLSRIRYLGHFDEVETVRMARAGDSFPVVEPYVFDILSKKSVRLNLETENYFVLLLGWYHDGGAAYLFKISRDMKTADVIEADAETGETKVLFSESCKTFIRIQHDVIGGKIGCKLLPEGKGFLWESERDGWKHLYHYDVVGNLVGQLTSGDWPACNILDIDLKGGWVYFDAHHDQSRPYDVHVCRVPLMGGAVERLTEGNGIHDAQFAPDYSYFVDTVQRPDLSPQSVVRDISGKRLCEFEGADLSALVTAGWSAPEQAVIKAADGETDLWALVIRPRDFDPSKKYPVIEYIYGGPQVAMVNHGFWMASYKMGSLNQALPALGYVVVVVDARGTPERSKAFQDAVYREWRRHVTADHASAVRNLAEERPWMDLDRVGIWGHSWGGYFTVANLLDNPGLYRAGIASAPGLDSYNLFLSEPYMGGVPNAETKAAYDDAVLKNDASKLQGQLMIVAGSNDLGVWHDAVKMTNALIEAGKQHEFVMLPNQHHGYQSAHEDYFIDKLVGFFDEKLKRV